MNGFGSKVTENLVFVMEFAAVVFVLFLIAYVVEKRVYLRKQACPDRPVFRGQHDSDAV